MVNFQKLLDNALLIFDNAIYALEVLSMYVQDLYYYDCEMDECCRR